MHEVHVILQDTFKPNVRHILPKFFVQIQFIFDVD